ncbi:cell wall hydrolase [Erythrobacter sp. GH1-10]|uniref:cell wall hydrolase n=1 Tax=Erythrobacter sp. GH1-10 TaxID=3349334 RepID=UPI0038782FCD
MKPVFALIARLGCLAAVGAFAAAPSLPIERVSKETIETQLGPALSNTLKDMSTGADQEVLLSGNGAQARNSRIPLVSGQLRSLANYTPIGRGTAQYSTALKCLTQAVYYEAANETRDGKRAVAQVVLNRMRHPAYPNSVCGVVYQGVNDRVCQFSFTCDGALLREPLRRQWDESLSVAKDALAGKQMTEVGTATHYHADYVVPKWAYTLSKLRVVGTHIFYRFPGRAGEPQSFAARWKQVESIPQINWARFNATVEDVPEIEPRPEDTWVPGLTVAPDPTDRHATTDVGGRIDTTKQWRLSLPDPVRGSSAYKETLGVQGESLSEEAEITE